MASAPAAANVGYQLVFLLVMASRCYRDHLTVVQHCRYSVTVVEQTLVSGEVSDWSWAISVLATSPAALPFV